MAKLQLFDEYQLQVMGELIKLFFPDENYLDEHYIMYLYKISLAKKSIQEDHSDQAFEHLKKARHHAAEMDKIEFDSPGEYHYTAPLFNKLTVDTSTFIHTNDIPALQQFAEILEKNEFDSLRNRDEFHELVNSLK